MGPLRVLILEDDQDIIDLIRSVLEPTYECCVASNGLEGLQQVEVALPDFAICDIMMPVMDGNDFIKRVHQLSTHEQMPVIFLSALSAPEQIKKGYTQGAALYLTKPIDPQRLKRNIDLFVKDRDIQPRSRRVAIDEVNRMQHLPEETQSRRVPPAREPAPVAVSAAGAGTPVVAAGAVAPPASHPAVGVTNMQRLYMSMGRERKQQQDRVRILIVEDDRDTCQMVRVGLGDQFDVLETNDGITAIEFAARYKPDIFIIDGMLPRMTGYQLAVMLKKNREFWRSPIVFISGKATQRDQQYVQKLGITHFLAKPFTVLSIQQIIRQFMETPGFAIRQDRLPFSQVHLEQFQQLETHRTRPTSIEQMEKNSVESVLKRQLH